MGSLAALRLPVEGAARERGRAEREEARRRAEEELLKLRTERQAEEARVLEAREREREAARPPTPPPPPPAPTAAAAATLAAAEGKVFAFAGLARASAEPGRALRVGDGVETADGAATIAFGDGTRIELAPGSEVREIRDAPAKRLRLVKGRLDASVTRQDRPFTLATPHGDAMVLGTTLRLRVEDGATRLDVLDGKVRFARPDGRSVDVLGGHYALSGELSSRALLSRARYEAALPRRPDVLFLEDFEANDWKRRWSSAPETSRVSENRALVLLGRRALEVDGWHRISLPRGVPTLHARAYVHFPAELGGTLFRIGAAVEDGKSLWADFTPNGRDFFSAALAVTRRGTLQLHVFHPDQADPKGEFLDGAVAPLALKPGRWHAVELMCRANDPGRRNGAVRAWLDGRLAAEVDGLRFRDVETLGLRELALPGSGAGPFYLDHVVLAREPVGTADVDGVPPPGKR